MSTEILRYPEGQGDIKETDELKPNGKMKLISFRFACVTSAQFTYFLKTKLPP